MRISDWSSDVCSSDLEAHGQERILVNCAGTGNAIKTASRSKEDGSIKHFPLDAFNWIIQINLVGTFRCIAKSAARSEEHTSELQSLMRISYAVFCLKKKTKHYGQQL